MWYIYIYMIHSVTHLASGFTLHIFNQPRHVKLVGMSSQSCKKYFMCVAYLCSTLPSVIYGSLILCDLLMNLSTYCFQLLTWLDLPMINPRLSRCNSMLLNEMWKPWMKGYISYLILRSISALHNPQNTETILYEIDMLKIIIIMIGYTVNNFIAHLTIS
jgi:hypothetical protein